MDAGSTLVMEGLPQPDLAAIGALAGTGTLANNNTHGFSYLRVGGNGASMTFSGAMTGIMHVTKTGTGTFTIGGQSNLTLSLAVEQGKIKLTGDVQVEEVALDKSQAGVQAMDLNGHKVRVSAYPLAIPGYETSFNQNAGTAADGYYDSTAGARTDLTIGVARPGGTLPPRARRSRRTWRGRSRACRSRHLLP